MAGLQLLGLLGAEFSEDLSRRLFRDGRVRFQIQITPSGRRLGDVEWRLAAAVQGVYVGASLGQSPDDGQEVSRCRVVQCCRAGEIGVIQIDAVFGGRDHRFQSQPLFAYRVSVAST